jgi:hypothetical protein
MVSSPVRLCKIAQEKFFASPMRLILTLLLKKHDVQHRSQRASALLRLKLTSEQWAFAVACGVAAYFRKSYPPTSAGIFLAAMRVIDSSDQF